MAYIKQILRALNLDKRAVTALEYGMIAALVAVVAAAGFKTLGNDLKVQLNAIGSTVSGQTNTVQ